MQHIRPELFVAEGIEAEDQLAGSLELGSARLTCRRGSLADGGFLFDYISDRQVASLKPADGALVAPGGKYRTLLLPPSKYIPLETLKGALSLTEQGAMVNGRGDQPNTHDILTGSQPDGTAFPSGEDRTCGNWTRGGAEGAAMVGHHDRMGLRDDAPSRSWNSSHPTRGGCSQEALQGTGGAGLIYCFKAG